MGEKDRDEKGRFKPESEIEIDAVEAAVSVDPQGTGEIADELGIPRRSVLRYLNDLSENSDSPVERRKIDGRRVVWFRRE